MSLTGILDDVAEHPWVLVGFSAFLLLIPLAVTSTNGWIRRLGGKRWARLHMLIYPTAVLGVLHFMWLVKADEQGPTVYVTILAVLLGVRAWIGLSDRRTRRHSGGGRTAPRASAVGTGSKAPARPPATKGVTLPS
jgi:sulfoxide reductase heme-binding subunit YedZ